MDRLSNLPDFIIHDILSYLDTEEAYRTSVLSKRWNQIFYTNPILDFYYHNFPTDMIPRYLEYIDTRIQKFSKENLRITKFILPYQATKLLSASKIDEWLEIAVRNQVAEIDLGGPANYKLPRFLFCAKSLTYLNIDNVEIPYYEAVDLVSLETLALGQVVVEERMLVHIVNSCPLLKELCLTNCSGFKNIVIPRHSKLEDFYIDGDVPVDGGRVIIETSSLKSFKYNTNGVNPWPIISNPGLLRNLRHLLVYDLSITDEDFAKLLPELTSLEKLELSGCDMLTNIKISHTQLKQIFFYDCCSLLNVVIDAPNLKKFQFDGGIRPPLSITIHSQVNCNIHVDTMAEHGYFDTKGFFTLKKLLKGLNSCNVLKIKLHDEPSKSNDEEEEAELGPPCDIGMLKLNLYSYSELSSSSLSDFLNGLFWTCHPPIISLRVHSNCHKLTAETLVNKLVDMVKCLDHPLKRIQVGETNSVSDFLNVQLRLCW